MLSGKLSGKHSCLQACMHACMHAGKFTRLSGVARNQSKGSSLSPPGGSPSKPQISIKTL